AYSLLSFVFFSQVIGSNDINLVIITSLLIKSAHESINNGSTFGKSILRLNVNSDAHVNYILRNFVIIFPVLAPKFIDNVASHYGYEILGLYYIIVMIILVYCALSIFTLYESKRLLHDYVCGSWVEQKPLNLLFIAIAGFFSLALYYSLPIAYKLSNTFIKFADHKDILYIDVDDSHCKYSQYEIP
ncbi:RDD family protein, partial [Vibrio anguillarum]